MSKKTHQRQLERAREKRQAQRAVQRSGRNRVLATLLVLALVFSIFVGALLARDDGDPTVTPSPTATPALPTANQCDLTGVEQPTPDAERTFTEQPARDLNEAAIYRVTIATTCGDLVLELDPGLGPNTVANFLALAESGYFDGVPFHRVIDGFMIQSGDPTGTGGGNPGYTIVDELAETEAIVAAEGGYPRGVIAMARPSNPDGSFLADSAGAQFFIVQGQSPDRAPYPLPAQYAIFGRTVEGLDIIDRIAAGPAAGPREDLAVNPVRILSIRIEELPAERPDDATNGPTDAATSDPTNSPTPTPTT